MARKQTQPVLFQGLEAGLKMFRWVVLVLVVLFFLSGFKTVNQKDVGLLLRFGRLQGITPAAQVRQPGLVTALPSPIDELVLVPGAKGERDVVIDEVFKGIEELAARDKIDPELEGYCLTGDQNIVQLKILARYRVSDPIRYQLHFAEPDRLVHDAVLASTVQTIASWKVDDVLRLKRTLGEDVGTEESLVAVVREQAQQRLDAVDSGIVLTAVEISDKNPPRHVVAEFRDVQSAEVEMMTMMHEANRFEASRKPAALADASRIIAEAKAYKAAQIAEATAEVTIFNKLREEYKKNPEMVVRGILLETWNDALEKAGEVKLVPPGTQVYQ